MITREMFTIRQNKDMYRQIFADQRKRSIPNTIESKVYDMQNAKKYIKKHGYDTEIVDFMFRNNVQYAKSISPEKYKLIAAICLIQGKNYSGCEVWDIELANAMEYFARKQSNIYDDVDSEEYAEKLRKKSDKVIRKIHEFLEENIVDGYTYELYEGAEDGLLEVTIQDDDEDSLEIRFVIDPYVIHGNKAYIMDSTGTAIPLERNEIISCVIYDKLISNSDWDEIETYSFSDKRLYKFFDLSGCLELRKISNEEYHIFEKRLIDILRKMDNQEIEVPRFRIKYFLTVDEFGVVADKKVKNNRYYQGKINMDKPITVSVFLDEVKVTVEE